MDSFIQEHQLSIAMEVQLLLKVKFQHQYYVDTNPSELRLEPTKNTRELLKNFPLLMRFKAKKASTILAIFVNNGLGSVDNRLTLLKSLQEEQKCLDFVLIAANPNWHLHTDTASIADDEIQTFNYNQEVRDNEELITKVEKRSSELNGNQIGLVKIELESLLERLLGTTTAFNPETKYITFQAKKAFYHFCFILNEKEIEWLPDEIVPYVSDVPSIRFFLINNDGVSLGENIPNNRKIVIFKSNIELPIFNYAHAENRFVAKLLKANTSDHEKDEWSQAQSKTINLPIPSFQNLRKLENEESLSAFVYVYI